MTADTYEPRCTPRSFEERLQRLCGESAYRMPVEGRSTRPGSLPAAYQLAAALGMARRMVRACQGSDTFVPDPDDVGPDIVMDMVVGRTNTAGRVVRTIAAAMASDRNRAARRCRPYMRIIVWAAYASVIGGLRQDQLRPADVTQQDWDLLTEAAERIMGCLADEALQRAERAFYAAGERRAA